MTAYTVPNLVFEAEPHDAVVVVSPAAGNATLTRHELKHASLEVADGIRACLKTTSAGIDGQPVVAMALPNGLGFVLAFLGVVARGVVAAPLNPAYTVPEFEVSGYDEARIDKFILTYRSSSTSATRKQECSLLIRPTRMSRSQASWPLAN